MDTIEYSVFIKSGGIVGINLGMDESSFLNASGKQTVVRLLSKIPTKDIRPRD